MKRSKSRLVLCGILTAAWLCFIWGNSMLPGKESSMVSGWVGRILEAILPFINMDNQNAMLILRKMGHFTEFAILGALLTWLFGMLRKNPALAFACGAGAAITDECIQLFSPGRVCAVTDMLIDSAGVIAGIAVLLVLHRLAENSRWL